MTEVLTPVFGPAPWSLIRSRDQTLAALADLYARKLTYGDFAKVLKEIRATMERDAADERYREQMLYQAQLQSQAAQQQANAVYTQAVETQRQRELTERAQAEARHPQAMQDFAKAFAPPPSINCTTNVYGDTARTHCQ
jgi:hypothetical protein